MLLNSICNGGCLSMNNNEITLGVKEFILGGNADFTIQQDPVNGNNGFAVKYRVVRNDNGSCWFVYTEIATTGQSLISQGKNLVYQGYLKRDMSFNVGKKGVSDYNVSAIKGLLWVLNRADNLPDVVHIYHHGRCSKCGRKLTDVESLRCGLGPTCRKRIGL